jgi:uncharacterized membrane protein YjgN (DUF898 family)
MEIIANKNTEEKRFKYFGAGLEFAIIYFKNILLTIITIGLYYPWAKVELLKYHYQSTELDNSRFLFHATGKEVFKGFIKIYAILIALYAFLIYASQRQNLTLITTASILFYMFLLLLIPLAIHGSVRYRASKSSWKGIHFKYLGDRKELFLLYIKGLFLTIITLGIYGAWLQVDLRKYVLRNLRFGDLSFRFNGSGGQLFWITVKFILLIYITLGIYGFWYYKNIVKFYVDNLEISQNGKPVNFECNIKTADIVELLVINFFLLVFSLGLATPWVTVRTFKFILRFITIKEGLDTESIQQVSYDDYDDATGDDFMDFLDFDLL